MSKLCEDDTLFLHNHDDWACSLTERGVFGKTKFTIFPQSWRDFGGFYETHILVIMSKGSYEAKDVLETLTSYDQIIGGSMLWEKQIEGKRLLRINLRAKHTPPYKSIISVAHEHKVEVRFICFENANEAVWVVTRKPRRVHRFLNSLREIGEFENFKCSSWIRETKNPQDLYYYFLLKTLGVRDELEIGVFNAVRHLIVFNKTISGKCGAAMHRNSSSLQPQ